LTASAYDAGEPPQPERTCLSWWRNWLGCFAKRFAAVEGEAVDAVPLRQLDLLPAKLDGAAEADHVVGEDHPPPGRFRRLRRQPRAGHEEPDQPG